MEGLAHADLLGKNVNKPKKKLKKGKIMPLIVTLLTFFVGVLILRVDNYVTPTDIPYVVLSPEAPTRTAVNLLALTYFDMNKPEDMP